MIYRARHIPTGQFFKPNAGYNKNNLSKKGKFYTSRPRWDWLKEIYIKGKSVSTQSTDWEIITYDLVESGTETI